MERARVAQLPKVVLHDHLDGGLRPETLLDLADAAGYDDLPGQDAAEVAAWMEQGTSGSLERYLEAFRHTVAVMQTPDAMARVAYEALEDLAADGVVYAELRFAPSLNTRDGMTLEEVLEAALDGMRRAERDHGIAWGLIVDALRHERQADPIARAAIRFFHAGVVGFDLAGPELGHPPDEHLAECRLVREAGLGLTLHAGEADGPQSIWRAFGRCHAQRIGHGVRIVEDTVVRNGEIVRLGGLARTLRDLRVPLELCPTSNVHTGVASSLATHPVGMLHRAGFTVTLNTDNRLISRVTMTDEYHHAVVDHGFGAADLEQVTVNALEAGFGDWDRRRALIRDVVRPAYAAVTSS
jgi:adenosine deaminase